MKKKNKKSKLKQIICRAFVIITLCFMLFFGVILAIYWTDMLLNSNNPNHKPLFSTYVILTPSMVPTIKVKDAIIVKRVDNDNYKEGDIITFNSNDENYENLAITHRIVEKRMIDENNSLYVTKGDNNNTIDSSSVRTDSIYGKVLFKIPKVGYIKEFFSKPTNYLFVLLVPASIIIFYNLFKILILVKKREKIYI